MNTETKNQTVESLCELMAKAYHLALSLAYSTTAPGGTYFDPREDLPEGELTDKVFCWVDGLMAKHYDNVSSGHCSLAATIAFDVAEWEKEVESDIALFTEALTRFPACRELTFDEMKARGYRGSGAGYTPEQDRLYYLDRARKGLAEALAEKAKGYEAEYKRNESIRWHEKEIAELESKAPKVT